MDPKSKAFKELEKKWYTKLEKSGFKDIEQPDGNLKVWASSACKNYAEPNVRAAKEEYYRMAGQFLYDYKFTSAIDKFAWKHHANGVSIRSIVGLLAKKGIKSNKRTIHEKLQRLAKEMLKGSGSHD